METLRDRETPLTGEYWSKSHVYTQQRPKSYVFWTS